MSTFQVKIEKIIKVENHPGADRLDLLTVLDWRLVTAKGNYKEGDLCLYIPIDSILPEATEAAIFGPDSKIKLTNSRVRTIKLRGAISQGMALKPETLGITEYELGQDFTEQLGITKYEPPVKSVPANMQARSVKRTHPDFKKYGGIENAKNYPEIFAEGEEVVVTEKIHGSLFRGGWLEFQPTTLWKKLLKLLRLAPKYEWVYGSNNVQLQDKLYYKGYYDENVYAKTANTYDLKNKLKPGEVVYGEIYGDGIQKNYIYGCAPGETRLIIFDLKRGDKYLDSIELKHWCKEVGLNMVPILYTGPFNKEKVLQLTNGDSVLCASQKTREGVVVKPTQESTCYIGRKKLKFISDAYLLKEDNTDFH